MSVWQFEVLRGGPRRTPQEAEFFKDEQSGEGQFSRNDHFVREVLQNALDARSKAAQGPVRVRLALHDETDAPTESSLANYFSRLQPALGGRGIDFTTSGVPKLPCRFLVCEDFGTRGLEGDPKLFADPPIRHDCREDFYWFWRNIGRSGKTGVDLGRWGLGKTVFRAVSQMGCMFGVTCRESDSKVLLMGQAVLQPHTHGGVEYHPEGYWCEYEGIDLPMPIVAGDKIEQFHSEWHLSRNGEPGCSIVSPYVPEDMRSEQMLQAVIAHFFTRVLRDELVVEVCGPEIEPTTVDSNSVAEVAASLMWGGSRRMKRHAPPPVPFVRECLAVGEPVETDLLGCKTMPRLDEKSFDPDTLKQLRMGFADGKLTAVRVRMILPQKKGNDVEGQMTVYVRRSGENLKHDGYYVREGMTIPKLTARACHRGVEAYVLADRGPLAELLGDSEGAAHETWSDKADLPERRWRKWKGRVNFACKIVDLLVEVLAPKVEGPDRDLLAGFFSIPEPSGSQHRPKRGEKEPGGGDFPPVEAHPKWFRISQRSGGFSVLRNRDVPLPETPTLRVALAYDLPRGNPLRNWSPLDFELGMKAPKLPPSGSGVKPKLLAGNHVELSVTAEEFEFSVNGFDEFRDLYVRVDDYSESNGEQTEDET